MSAKCKVAIYKSSSKFYYMDNFLNLNHGSCFPWKQCFLGQIQVNILKAGFRITLSKEKTVYSITDTLHPEKFLNAFMNLTIIQLRTKSKSKKTLNFAEPDNLA